MANDIDLAIDSNPIKNGTTVVQCRVTGFNNHDTYNQHVKNTPVIADIQAKYDNRFDDPSYYYGSGGVDGGDV